MKTIVTFRYSLNKENSLLPAVVSLLLEIAIVPTTTFATDTSQYFQIQAQSLDKALITFANQAHLKIIFDTNKTHTVNVSSFKGTMTTHQVLAKLLQGSGYTYQYVDNHTTEIVNVVVTSTVKTYATFLV